MDDRCSWDAPAVFTIDVARGTHGGCPSLPAYDETTYTSSCIGPVS